MFLTWVSSDSIFIILILMKQAKSVTTTNRIGKQYKNIKIHNKVSALE